MAVLLINRIDIQDYRQLSDTVYDEVLNQHILDAQFVDIQKLLGYNLYNDLILNYTDTKYTALLDGGSYVYNTVTYTNHGLKAVLVHYAYVRYVMYGSQTDTPFGLVEKLSTDSKPVDTSQKKAVSKSNEQTAWVYWENVRTFLDRNKTTYPLWDEACLNTGGGFRISKII